MKRIAPRDVNNVNIHSIAIPSEGWARIAELKVCESGLISIYSAWSENNPPRTILLAYSIGAYYSRYHKIVQVCGTASKIKKVRLVSKDASNLGPVFLEIYVDHGVTVYTTCITPSNAVVFSSYQDGNVPAGYVSNEITIVNSSQFGGGVNRRFTKSCKTLHLPRFRKQRPRRGLTAARSRRKTEYCLTSY